MSDRRREEMNDRELLIRIDERTEALKERMDGVAPRLRWLEAKTWVAIGGLGVVIWILSKADLKLNITTPAAAAASVTAP